MQVPVLADLNWNGMPKKVMMWANRNGYFYVLDRTSGECLVAKPYVRVNWSSGWMKTAGRLSRRSQTACQPIRAIRAGQTGTRLPSSTHWPLLLQRLGGLRNDLSLGRAGIYPGRAFLGGGFSVLAPAPDAPTIGIGRTNPVNNWTDEVGHASLKAMDPNTGKEVWEFEQYDVSDSGMLTTVTDLLITGGGKVLPCARRKKWRIALHKNLGGQIVMAPVTYMVDGVQYVSIISGNSLFTFAPKG